MKAVILKKPGEFFISNIADPACPPGGLLIKVKAAAICSADVKMMLNGHPALQYPRIPGHEISGVVVNSDNSIIGKGLRVQVAPGITCGKCKWCLSGLANHCKNIKIIGFSADGGFSEYISIPAEGVDSGIINILPENLDFNQAALAEPVACCINGQEAIGIFPDEKVLIIGAGPIGCIHSLLARLKGAGKVILADNFAQRLSMVGDAGADTVVDLSSGKDFKKIVLGEAGPWGVDKIIIACSTPGKLIGSLMEVLVPRGKICFFSGIIPGQEDPAAAILNNLHYKEAVFAGAYGCTSAQNTQAIALMSAGKINLNWMINNTIKLKDIRAGIEMVKKLIGLKTVIEYEED